VTEPTLLQQARQHMDSRVYPMPPEFFHIQLGLAVECMLQVLESWSANALPAAPVSIGYERSYEPKDIIERLKANDAILRESEARQAAMRGPAHELRCCVCGWQSGQGPHHDHGPWGHPVEADIGLGLGAEKPGMVGLTCRVDALEAMSAAHRHNIATLFRDVEALPKNPAQVPSDPKCKVCGHVADSAPHRWGSDEVVKHDFEPDERSLSDRVADLEAMSEAHGHNIATLFRDVEALPKPVQLLGTTEASALDLDELQRLCDAATPGPWEIDDEGDLRAVCAGYDESRGLMQLVRLYAPVALATERPEWESHPPDVAFVSAARDALPKLIARVRELQARVDHSEKELEWNTTKDDSRREVLARELWCRKCGFAVVPGGKHLSCEEPSNG